MVGLPPPGGSFLPARDIASCLLRGRLATNASLFVRVRVLLTALVVLDTGLGKGGETRFRSAPIREGVAVSAPVRRAPLATAERGGRGEHELCGERQ